MTERESIPSGFVLKPTEIADAISSLDTWLQTMRQPGGYGGPVSHWWRNNFRYTGPGLDWRYEGILIGYHTLWKKTGQPSWRKRLNAAANDLLSSQLEDGSFPNSRFELNQGSLGTPHEAALSRGLLAVAADLDDPGLAVDAAERCLRNLVSKLQDAGTGGFNDRPGVTGRVPNKLATFAEALFELDRHIGSREATALARRALDDVLRYQVKTGAFAGAIHQYVPRAGTGDGKFFPVYNARCVPALLMGANRLGDERYTKGASDALEFLKHSMLDDGSWPQIVYANGHAARYPSWIAGSADTIRAFHAMDVPVPQVALRRLLDNQHANGGFATSEGFRSRDGLRVGQIPDYRDVVPVVGWNDKALRLLADLLPAGVAVPDSAVLPGESIKVDVLVGKRSALFEEDSNKMRLSAGQEQLYLFHKNQRWADGILEVLRP